MFSIGSIKSQGAGSDFGLWPGRTPGERGVLFYLFV